uniref:Uncharacterized protein n=1 Tax=Timema monikensis TaxID=170555 RepID=A0A7R9HV25_9NEOP|nr:unnamed protein product [Timema monikensis]
MRLCLALHRDPHPGVESNPYEVMFGCAQRCSLWCWEEPLRDILSLLLGGAATRLCLAVYRYPHPGVERSPYEFMFAVHIWLDYHHPLFRKTCFILWSMKNH